MKRFAVVSISVFFLFSLLIVQFYRLQIVQREKWTALAERQHVGLVYEPFQRGTFWSNTTVKAGHPPKKQPLVRDVPKWHLHIDPASIPPTHRGPIHSELSRLVGEVKASEFEKKSRNRRLKMWLDRSTHDEALEWWLGYARTHKIPRNALFFVKDYQRSYPFGSLLGQALHTIRDFKDEETKQGIPTGGLESYFNAQLKGKRGKRLRARTPRHSLDVGKMIEPPEHGADITLTINHYLQAIAEEEVEKGVKKAQAKAGWAVVMNPHTGEVLALAQYPFFYPRNYRDYFNDEELAQHALVKSISSGYEPGSVMKAITVSIALEANKELLARGERPLFSPTEKIATRSGKFPGRSKPLTDARGHDYLNLDMAIQKSSNIYMATLMKRVVERLGDEWYFNQLHDVFGFGTATNIELPGESAGFLPKVGGHYPTGRPQWSRATPYSLAMGYNLLVNSMQMLRASALIANGGKFVQPTLVREITKDGECLYSLDDHLADHPPERRLDPNTCARVVEAMKYTPHPGGSARRASLPGYTTAGKTGTSEKVVGGKYSKKTHFTTYIGFAPANDPALIVLVAVDEPKHLYIPGVGTNHMGGTCAAPVFRQLASRSLEYLGVRPDDPDDTHWKAEVASLREIYESWNHRQNS